MKTQTCLTPTEINKTAIKERERVGVRGECQVGHSTKKRAGDGEQQSSATVSH